MQLNFIKPDAVLCRKCQDRRDNQMLFRWSLLLLQNVFF